MKYIKLFELFENPKKIEFTFKKINDNQYGYYFDIEDKRFGVYFDVFNGMWERNYFRIKKNDEETPYSRYEKPYGIANKIISSVTYITEKFFKKFKPTILKIVHIPMENENNLDGTRLNKRAFINYQYLKNLPIIKSGKYELRYYNRSRIDTYTNEKKYGVSICLIIIKGFNGFLKIEHDENYERFYPQ